MTEASDKYIADAIREYICSILGVKSITENSVHMLIQSHSRLRKLNLEAQQSYEEYVESFKELRKAQLENSIVDEFIRGKLKNMTLQEVANFIGEDA